VPERAWVTRLSVVTASPELHPTEKAAVGDAGGGKEDVV
jgi:hypothetical protein